MENSKGGRGGLSTRRGWSWTAGGRLYPQVAAEEPLRDRRPGGPPQPSLLTGQQPNGPLWPWRPLLRPVLIHSPMVPW